MGQATIRDVARRAEVSVASVSRALNGLEGVHPDTKARIIAAAGELGYVPHAGARSLSLARAHAIGVVLPDLHGEFFSEILRGMDREATRRGYLLLLSNIHSDGQEAADALRTMRGRVDGMLVMAPHLSVTLLERSLPAGLPALLLNSRMAERPSIRIDNALGAELVVRRLVADGARRIAHISGPAGNIDARERAEGYRAALATHAPGMQPLVIQGNFDEDSGEAAARLLISDHADCDAVFAANDMMALGCLQGFRNAGVDVPGAVAIVGFDDIPLSRYLGLSTVSVRIAEFGERALARVIDLLERGGEDGGDELHAPALVARATTRHSCPRNPP